MIVLSAILTALVSAHATAQPCYHVTDIGELGFTPDQSQTFGINDAGEVALAIKVGNDLHAHIWLPWPNYGFDSWSPIDIHPTELEPSAAKSFAHDISNSGYVVGVVGDTLSGDPRRAFAWELGPPMEHLDLSNATQFPPPPNIEFSPKELFGVNDASVPMAVGDSRSEYRCFCPPSGTSFDDSPMGFRVKLEPQSFFIRQLPKVDTIVDDCDQGTGSRDINNDEEVVGFSQRVSLPVCPAPPGDCTAQGVDLDGSSWNHNDPNVFVELDDLGPQSRALGNNHASQVVGYGWEPSSPCRKRAMFWETRDSPYFNLGIVADLAGSETIAEAINDPNPSGQIQVVGTDETETRGLVWTRETPSSDWGVSELSERLIRCSTHWEILRAYDINDSGQIIALADTPPGGSVEYHAVLLTPMDVCPQCDSDSNGDGEVDVQDFLHLLADWGPCPTNPTVWCRSDINCDGTADISDFMVMLNEWGPCGNPRGGPTQTVQDCIDKFGFGNPELLEKCICAVEPEECLEE